VPVTAHPVVIFYDLAKEANGLASALVVTLRTPVRCDRVALISATLRSASAKADAFATDDVLLYGFIATDKSASGMKVVGEYLSYDPYGLIYRRDDPGFATVVDRAFARMAGERRLTELYNKWFLRRLPTREMLNVPMSPQLEEVFRVLGQPE
jgi:hypothetical protein